jgi:hypothetical protein
MTDDEIELALLRRYIEQHKAAELADPKRSNKCTRELDMRELLQNITGESGQELEYAARFYGCRESTCLGACPRT